MKNLIVFGILLACCFSAAAENLPGSDIIRLTDIKSRYIIGKSTESFVDAAKHLTINDVNSKKYDKLFIPEKSDIPNKRISQSAVWIRFSVINLSSEDDWVLEINYPPLQKIDLYYRDSSGEYNVKRIGTYYPHSTWEKNERMPVLRLPAEKNVYSTFYLRIESETSIVLPMYIITESVFAESSRDSYFLMGGYYGIILVMFLYNLFLFVSIKEGAYLYYVFYLLGYGLYQFAIDGLGFQFIWPDSSGWNLLSFMFFIGIYFAFGSLFTKDFLKIGKRDRPLNLLLDFTVFWGIFTSAMVFFLPFTLIDMMATYYAFFFVFLLLSAGIYSIRKGYKPAKYYLAAISFLLAGVLLRALRILGIIPMSFSAAYGWQVGSLLEMILLSFALGNKVRTERQEKRKEIERVRGEIASDLHDEIGSNLGSIGLMIQRTMKCSDIPPENMQQLREAAETVFKTAESLRDIVWFIAPDHDSLEQTINHLSSITGKLLPGIDYEFTVDPLIYQKKNLRLHRYLYLMYKEILHNIVKHSGATEVKINFCMQGSSLVVSIRDNGKGIEVNSFEKGMGLKNLQKRALTIGSELDIIGRQNEGTEVIIKFGTSNTVSFTQKLEKKGYNLRHNNIIKLLSSGDG
ncbi:MAG: 7TM diverse intracellular signaling domain-containing protein [Syntrophomonadaceae bacterium]